MEEQPFKCIHQTEDDWWEKREKLDRATTVITKIGVIAVVIIFWLFVKWIW